MSCQSLITPMSTTSITRSSLCSEKVEVRSIEGTFEEALKLEERKTSKVKAVLGSLDEADKCRDLPETMNGFDDEDRCPDLNPRARRREPRPRKKVFFEFAEAIIRKQRFPLLNKVASAIQSLPEGKQVIVESHTDSVGADIVANKKLSQARARPVRTYLVGRGIDPQRLDARGFGEEQPLSSNRSEAGRENNRRVEFTIVDALE
ncbi:MAG: OmpA family protein [Deltaproteobacteria bacterium]|nr:OmpA family protein [Deltaproteobacteria bacterium]